MTSLHILYGQHTSTSKTIVSLICVEKDGKYGFIDEMGSEVIPCKFDHPGTFSEGWVALKKGRSWCYYDANGSKVLDLKSRFTYCGKFSDGAAMVSTLPTKKAHFNSKTYWKNMSKELQYINRKGEVLFKIDNQWDISAESMRRYGFSDGLLHVRKEKDPISHAILFGFLDKRGQLVIPFKFRAVSNASETFSDGLADVGVREYLPNGEKPTIKYGYINKKGDWQIPPIYRIVQPFNSGAAFVGDTLPNQYCLIDKQGARIFPPQVESFPRKMKDSLVAVSIVQRSPRKSEIMGTRRWAIAKTDGTLITDFKFSSLDPGITSDDPWRASLPDDAKTIGYVNDAGKVVIPYQFAVSSRIFDHGLAIVKVKEENYPQGVINTKGKFVLPPTPNANYQIIGLVTNNAITSSNYYNKDGRPVPLEGYMIRGSYQHLTISSK